METVRHPLIVKYVVHQGPEGGRLGIVCFRSGKQGSNKPLSMYVCNSPTPDHE